MSLCKDQADTRPAPIPGVNLNKINIIGFCLSPDSRALQLYCQASGLDYQYVEVNMLRGEHKSDKFKEAYPSGHFPILQDGFQAVYGSSFTQMLHIHNRHQTDERKDRMNMKNNLVQLRKLFENYEQRVRPVTQSIRSMLAAQKFAPA